MVRKKSTKKKRKVASIHKKEIKSGEETPKKSVIVREDKQLIWFFVIVGVIFLSFLGPYLWIQSTKSFDYGNVEWVFEDEVNYYHGRFAGLTNENITYNIYVRTDPRENDVSTNGTFDTFKHGAVISTSPKFDLCRGDASRVMRDLGDFLKTAVGVNLIASGSTDEFVALETERRYALCNTVADRTVIIVDVGDNAVIKDSKNPYCYTIYVGNCNDASAVEKFMLKSIIDFGEAQ